MRDRKVNWSNTVTIPSQNKKPNNKTKPNKKHTSKQTKTHNTKQTEQGKSGRQTSYVTSVMNKRDILVSSLFWAKVVQFPHACVAHFFNTTFRTSRFNYLCLLSWHQQLTELVAPKQTRKMFAKVNLGCMSAEEWIDLNESRCCRISCSNLAGSTFWPCDLLTTNARSAEIRKDLAASLSTASSDVSKPEAESLDTRTAPPKQQVPYLWPSPFQTSEQLCVENLLFWGQIFFKKADPSWKISNKFDWVGKGHSPGRCNQSCMVCLQSCFIGQTSTLCLRRKLLPLSERAALQRLKKFEGRGLDFLTEESTQTQESDPRLR